MSAAFGVRPPPESGKYDPRPGYMGSFFEALNGLFGLVPHWATDTKITRSTYNARSETVAEKRRLRDA